MNRAAAVLALLLALGPVAPALAVQPDEILSDPVLEARAREISAGLRCPVCLNESIDESNAAISRELRLLIRERLVAGDSDRAAIDFVVARYGEFVLMRPDARGGNLVLWIAGPAMFLAALAIVGVTLRRRSRTTDEAPDLSEEERRRLDEILSDRG
ncbi:MAG: cytochrome c-type biogenesis protein CcmH [Rubellimicrobium sp.]|nr:cytochrome c-type biogenesis protein CcmH [Rubellimicrobium sp.]